MEIQENRLVEFEQYGPRDSYLLRAELEEFIKTYRNRIKGLTVAKKDDGVWITFTSKKGNSATLNVEALANERGPITRDAILSWSEEL